MVAKSSCKLILSLVAEQYVAGGYCRGFDLVLNCSVDSPKVRRQPDNDAGPSDDGGASRLVVAPACCYSSWSF